MSSVPAQDARLGQEASAGRLALVLLVAVAARLWIVATHTYVVWPDETFQYLEPAHRLLFGAGVVTWEYLDGIRSWLLPGLVAGVMGPVSLLDSDPAVYVTVLRLLCVLASLIVPFAGFRLVERRCGPIAGMLAGLLCALASETVYFAPVVMAEPLATDAALLAILLGNGTAASSGSRRHLLAAGLLFGLAASLRYQYGPILGVVATVQHARLPRALGIVAAGALLVVVVVLGGLDWLTWGSPFQSVWLNYQRNTADGISSAMGTQSPSYYGEYYLVAWGLAAPVLLACAVLGTRRLPVLAVTVLCTIALHSLVPHKELRFVFLATACIPMLVGAGLAEVLRRMPRLYSVPVAVLLSLAIAGYTAVWTYERASPPDQWHRFRSELQATAAARAYPDACGLAIRAAPVYETGGYTYWHRDAPIYFETWDEVQDVERLTFKLPLENVLDGRSVPQFPRAALTMNSSRFNVMIGTRGAGLPGFAERGCYGLGVVGDPEFCVFVRPGRCK